MTWQGAGESRDQNGQLLVDDLPDDVVVHRVVPVHNAITSANDVLPRDFVIPGAPLSRDAVRSLADDLEDPRDGELSHAISVEVGSRPAANHEHGFARMV